MIPANNHPEIDRLIHLKKHLGGMTMSKLISCQFNIDTAYVELVFDDGSQISIDCTAVENEVADNRFQRSELDYLIYNDPLAYADLVLNGNPEAYQTNNAYTALVRQSQMEKEVNAIVQKAKERNERKSAGQAHPRRKERDSGRHPKV